LLVVRAAGFLGLFYDPGILFPFVRVTPGSCLRGPSPSPLLEPLLDSPARSVPSDSFPGSHSGNLCLGVHVSCRRTCSAISEILFPVVSDPSSRDLPCQFGTNVSAGFTRFGAGHPLLSHRPGSPKEPSRLPRLFQAELLPLKTEAHSSSQRVTSTRLIPFRVRPPIKVLILVVPFFEFNPVLSPPV